MLSGHIGDVATHISRSVPPVNPDLTAVSNEGEQADVAAPVQPKPSRAFAIWFCMVAIVLGNLLFQTTTSKPSYNFLIEGNAASLAADVVIDGKTVGKIDEYNDSGVKIYGLRCTLQDGTHSVGITKNGYQPFSADVQMRGEDYLGFRLKNK